ncbi:ABC transporter permease [Clostridium kluyveri]|uniref:ABC transporter permease n=1 Tax=Clostridium kluyveri TaxID=1534 RepID=UPI002246B801|nr:FtsX-like permease family protein [Clostridium kluyveri]UZQ51394.1 FtsX-like permease family protein [Clostridium kluyveri]
MKSYKEITNKHLKHNKKRTVLTIFGIILSVALITSVGLFIKSLQNSFIESTIKSEGGFHVEISDISNEDYNELKNNAKIDTIGIQENWFECDVNGGKKIEIDKFDKNSLELLPDYYKAIKGRLPQKEGEIALENWIFKYMDNSTKIGDTVKLRTADGEIKNFKITGIIPNQIQTQYSGIALGMTYSNKFDMKRSTIYMTIYKSAGIRNTVDELSKKFKENCISNKHLLDYLGEGSSDLNKSLYSTAAIVIVIIIMATTAVIYNSFQISVMERIKQFGLLRAVGATPSQIRKIVLREASIISIVGIPLGLLGGIFAMFVVSKVFSIMSDTLFGTLKIVIPYYVLIISVLVGLAAVYISAFIPARSAGKVSPLAAISSRAYISKEKINRNRGRILKNFLNVESVMAFKNIKRNRKKFRVTVFSMVISIALFIFFSAFISMMQNFTEAPSESDKMHFQVIGIIDKSGDSSLKTDIINKIKKNNLVDKAYISYGTYKSNIFISDSEKNNYIDKNAPEIYKKVNFENQVMNSLDTVIDIYDKDKMTSIKDYIKDGKMDTDYMKQENGVIIVKNNIITVNKKYYNGAISNLKVGDSFYINKNMLYKGMTGEDYTEENNGSNLTNYNMVKAKVAAVVESEPYYFYNGDNRAFHIIMTKDVMKNITGKDTDNLPIKTADITLKDEKNEDKFNEFIQPLCDSNGVKLRDIVKINQSRRADSLQLLILMYGFIAVISFIGAVNIINTITTNLVLRRKEIASLNALGMTYENIRFMILTEGVLYGLYGAFYGGIVGSLLSYALSSPMRKIMDFTWTIPWNMIFISAIAAVFIGLISVIKPLSKIKKENIIDVIREED